VKGFFLMANKDAYPCEFNSVGRDNA